MQESKRFSLKPNSDEIKNAGQICGNFLESLGLSEGMIQSQIMILKELIRNGIKCGKFSPSKEEISVHLRVSDDTIIVEVKNPVDKSCRPRLEKLDRCIQVLRGYQDPYEAYQKMQILTGKQADADDFNGLALSEMAYKNKAILDFYVGEDKTLNQSAVRNIV